MRRTPRSSVLLSLLLLTALPSSPSSASASTPAPATPTPTRLSPLLDAAFAHLAKTGQTLPWLLRDERFERDGLLPVVVRFRRPPTAAELASFTASPTLGKDLEPTIAGTYLARISQAGLRALEANPNVTRVVPDLRTRAPLPEASSRVETGVDRAARAVHVKDGSLLDGTGTTIFDLDTAVFLFHPGLFRADGGYLPWVDVNGNGQLDVDVDGVDLDGNGAVAPEEVLHRIESRVVTMTGGDMDASSTFRPGTDFLYCDTNGNGQRDYGKGFTEDTPAYGEPLFVLDDANADGAVRPSEKLVRLQTSKIKALRDGTTTYERGGTGKKALVNYGTDWTPEEIFENSYHGTGVAGILVGGTPGISRWLGLAPNADLIVGVSSNDMTSTINWGLKQKPTVVLTEYAPYNVVSLDGSSEEDAIYDAAVGKGTVVVSPAGNLATSKKHAHVTLQAGANTFTIKTDERFVHSTWLIVSLHDRSKSGRALDLHLRFPGGQVIDVPENSMKGTSIDGVGTLYAYATTTGRGTVERHFMFQASTGVLPMGDYQVQANLADGPPIAIDAYVGDDQNAWEGGPSFEDGSADRTLCAPSTGDETITVGAYVLQDGDDYGATAKAGDLATYSSRGPRIDGEAKMNVVAPDNPISFFPPYGDDNSNTYAPFGGTSGAGPHVAASVALLRQLFPDESAAQLRDRILSKTKKDAFVGTDAAVWGAGKLDFAAASGLSIADGDRPLIALTAPKEVPAKSDVELTIDVIAGDPNTLKVRWDFDYDGNADTEWLPMGPQKVPTGPEGSALFVKAEVLDGNGNVGADTLLAVVGPEAAPATPAGAETTTTKDDGCGCHVAGGERRALFPAGIASALAMGIFAARRRTRRRA